MAGRIKGITVEIGGDTTGLEKALKSVNTTIRNTQSQLKDVNRLLKLDPSNTELLSQKQRALKEATSTSVALAKIDEAGENGAYVVAVDINSGMNGDTGEAELAVKSDLTVSIGAYKTGFFEETAGQWIGDLVNKDIGIVFPGRE